MAPFLLCSMSWLARSCQGVRVPRKRRRRPPAALEIATLPADVVLEIVARTDFFTLIRCAAVCKHLRRDILSPPFIRRVSQQVAPCIIVDLCTYNKIPLTLAHPPTPAAASFCNDRLLPFMSRDAADILREYNPVTSCHGLFLLIRRPLTVRGNSNYRHVIMRPESERNFELCVYNPMTGQRTFLAEPPGIQSDRSSSQKYVLLTSVDDIDDSFMLLFAYSSGWRIRVHVATTSSSTWEPVPTQPRHHRFPWWSVKLCSDPAVLHGGILHWLTHLGDQIVSYDMSTGMPRQMKLPLTNHKARQVHLATSSDGSLLKLLTIEGYKISVWLQLPTVPTDGGSADWSLQNVIDIEDKIWHVCPNIPLGAGTDVVVEFDRFGKRTGDVMLLRVQRKNHDSVLLILDLKTNEMHVHMGGSWPLGTYLEIDLSYRLQTMKVFS